ncbi:MAG TPA: pilus assembly protein PilM [Patescibacteria group bacterium]|nr:pilus assembly protein PilM [Patescibacteria group bacterium]
MLNLFNKKAIGLDIADHTVEVAEMEKSGLKIEINSLGRIKLKPGIVEKGRIKNPQELRKFLKEVFKKAKPNSIEEKQIVFGLPESQVYTEVFLRDKKDDKEEEDFVNQKVKETVPLPEDDLVYSYKKIKQDKKKETILAVAADRKVIREWQDFFEKSDLDLRIFDIETLAVYRSLGLKESKKPVIVCDFGAETVNISIFTSGGLEHSYTILRAGRYLTEELAKSLKISEKQAEQKKKKINLKKGTKGSSIVIKHLQPIVKEMKKAIDFYINNVYANSEPKKEKDKNKFEKIILVGGTARLKGLSDYLATDFKIKVVKGTSVYGEKNNFLYLEAMGLAVRELERKWRKRDPAFELLSKKRKQKKKTKQKETIKTRVKAEEVEVSEENKEIKKNKKQIIILLLIVIFGALFVSGAFWLRNYFDSQKKQEENKTVLSGYKFSEKVSFELPVAVNPREYTSDRIRGRLIADKNIKEEHEKTVKANLADQWLAFSASEADKQVFQRIQNKVKGNEFILDKISYISALISENEYIYLLNGEADISSKTDLDFSADSENREKQENQENKTESNKENMNSAQKKDKEVNIEEKDSSGEQVNNVKVLIKENSLGWLNVRQGAGTDFSIILKVYPGEEYFLLEEDDDWFKIKISEDEQGWVYSSYVEKVKHVD